MNPALIANMLKSMGMGDVAQQAQQIGATFARLDQKLNLIWQKLETIEGKVDAMAHHLEMDVPVTPEVQALIEDQSIAVVKQLEHIANERHSSSG